MTQRVSPLALKFLRDVGDPEIFRRFVAEARILGSVRHPNLVPAVEINLAHNPPYYAMPLMKESLRERLSSWKRGGNVFRAKYAIDRIILTILGAVAELHSRGIIHKDIKPDNIFLDASDAPRLGDLGICHFPAFYFPDLLVQSVGMGTQGYSAPETLRWGVGTPESDIFSLGIVLYELLTGYLPPPNWRQQPRHWPSHRHPQSCHRYVDQVLARMTDPVPARRYRSIRDVAQDLATISTGYLSRLPAYQAPARPLPRVAILPMRLSDRVQIAGPFGYLPQRPNPIR